jgi:anionic cell wall polymer biosynthesis LytR-Cps2A-Psr (LCP) family protein
MATNQKEKELVALSIPRDSSSNDPNLFISVNGKNYILPKGKTSMVPPHIAAEYHRAERAKNVTAEHIEEMLEATKQPVATT